MRKQLFANLNWLMADRILRIAGSLVIGIWVARYLGPGDFGLLNFALSFVALFGVMGRLSLDPVAVRELTKHPEKEKEILGSVLRLKLWGGIVAAVVALPAAWLAQPDNPLFIALVAIMAIGILFGATDAIDIFYQAKVLSKNVVMARMYAFLMISLAKIGLILGGFSVIWFALAATLEIALAAALLAWAYHRREGKKGSWGWRSGAEMHLLRDGWPLVASSLLIIIHTRIDQVMIGQMLDDVQVGLYSAAISISEAWLFVPGLIVQTVMPYFVHLRERNPESYQQRLMQLYSAMFWIGVAAGLAAILLGRQFIQLLFGEAYAGAYGPLAFTIWTGIFAAQTVARGIWLISENLQVYRLLNNLITVPANVILNYLWIPEYGINGAAAASLVSISFGSWIVPLLFKSLRKSNLDMIRSINPRYMFLKS
jgi:PST family polysaccharide transporter